MIAVNRGEYRTDEEDWAFNDGVQAGVKAMCKKFNIDERRFYLKW